ncbi:hypothetical protein RhiirC2_784598 [Rhizophagus irregularis]|uniref:RRM domain-containing protein n=1 Tax=Rhizophagus irregularis TaxID=588596 RepID=A0A2N1MY57_9GLOM|nr:hypothetical protein RhiirC2_784598 [Rhizophagus irregularis]
MPPKNSGSDISNSDNQQTNNKNNPSKRTRTLPENPIEEDYVADSAADAKGSNTTPSQQNNTDNFSSPPPKDTTAPSAPGSIDILNTNDTSPLPLDTPTISILRRDYQTAAAPNISPEFVKKYPTNRAMIDAVNNLLLETYHSYTGRARMSGSGDLKKLQLRTDENLRAIQVIDIPFFIKKDDITALFKKYDVHLAPLVRAVGAMAVNIPLSLNFYKPKRWAYITFKSQQIMDTAMEQSIALQGHRLQWKLLENTNKLCHRCGKLGCAPTACPLNNSQGRSRTCNPVAHLKERFNIGQSNNNNSSAKASNAERNNNTTNNTSSPNSSNFNNSTQSAQRLRSNDTATSNLSGHKPPLVDPNCSQIQEIFSVLKSLQEDMASVRARIHALELADQRMSRLELRHPPLSNTIQPALSSRSFSNPVLTPPTVPVPRSTIPSSPIPETADEATIDKERAEIYSFQRSLDTKFDHLSGSIERFISSISGGSSSDLVNKTSSD